MKSKVEHKAVARIAGLAGIRFFGGSVLAVLTVMVPASAMASSLTQPSLAQPNLATYSAQAGGTVITVPGTVTENTCDSHGCGPGSTTVSGETVSVSGSSSGGALAYPFSGTGTILYYYCVANTANMCITDQTPAFVAMVDVSATVSVSAGTAGVAGTDALAQASVGVQGLSGSSLYVCATSAPGPQPCSPNLDIQSSTNIATSVVNDVASATAFLNDAPFSIFSDVIYEVELTATGQSNYGNGSSGDGTVTAMADPTIILDPTWAAENPGYSLLFSSNITSSPEPSSWTLLSAGLLATGFAIYRRKQRVE